MRLPSRPYRDPRPAVELPRGERLLAWARTPEGEVVAATRDAVYLPDGRRVPWEEVESADWDVDTGLLRVVEVGSWGQPRPVHEVQVGEPRRLLELVRERVTASVVLQRHVPVHHRAGVRVIARRPPSGRGQMIWVYEFDAGVDPDDPAVRRAAEEAMAQAHVDVGLD